MTSSILSARLRVYLPALLLSVACGGRTGIDGALSTQAPEGAAGSSSTSPLASWDKIDWDTPRDELALYLWTGSPKDTWAVLSGADDLGSFFQRAHWDGSRLATTAHDGTNSQRFGAGQVWGASSARAVGGSSQSLQRWSGATWTDWADTPSCTALGGSADDDLWCATDLELWHWDGQQWTHGPMSGIQGILALARDDVWLWGAQGASHFDGVTWTSELSGLVRSVSAADASDVWAVQDGDLLHAAGAGAMWTRQNPTGSQIAGVWSQSRTNTWIVAAGAAMRWNGSTWLSITLPAFDELFVISGSNQDVWIGGSLKLMHGRAAGR